MSKNEKQLAALVVAVAGCAYLTKVAHKEARALGIPLVAVGAVIWALGQ